MDMVQTGAAGGPRGAGKAQAIGQLAKQAVAEARAGGADLPRNAQGLAASGLAKGAGFATLVAALMPPPPVTETPLPPGAEPVPESDPAESDAAGADVMDATVATQAYRSALEAQASGGAETALDLLAGGLPDQP